MKSVKFMVFQMCIKSPADNSNMRTDSNQICIMLISIAFSIKTEIRLLEGLVVKWLYTKSGMRNGENFSRFWGELSLK